MGQRGKPKRPVELTVLTGETRPSRVNYRGPQLPKVSEPRIPRDLSAEGRRIWRDVMKQLRPTRMLTEADGRLLAVFCEHYVNHIEITKLVRASSYLVLSKRTGDLVKNPLVGMMLREALAVRALGHEFGLTPSGRTSMVLEPMLTEDPLDQLFS